MTASARASDGPERAIGSALRHVSRGGRVRLFIVVRHALGGEVARQGDHLVREAVTMPCRHERLCAARHTSQPHAVAALHDALVRRDVRLQLSQLRGGGAVSQQPRPSDSKSSVERAPQKARRRPRLRRRSRLRRWCQAPGVAGERSGAGAGTSHQTGSLGKRRERPVRGTGAPRRGAERSTHLMLEVKPGCGVNGSVAGDKRRGTGGRAHAVSCHACLHLRLRVRCGSRIRIRTLRVQPACASMRGVCRSRLLLCLAAQQLRCDAVAATRFRGPRHRSRSLQCLRYLRLR